MAYSNGIDDPSAHFTITLYTGDGSNGRAITNSANAGDFQPDWLWYKERSNTSEHRAFDSSRGNSKRIEPNNTNQEATDTTNHQSFDSNGFTIGNSGSTNANGDTYVAWQWIANGGSTTTNDASATSIGTIDSVYQANTTAGFSIVTYTGTGSNGTIAHGLGATPKVVIIKNRDRTETWRWGDTINESGFGKQLLLNDTDAIATDNNTFNDTNPTSTVFSVGTRNATNASGEKLVAYCFAEKKGYSQFGTYLGDGNIDGPFLYMGFRPKYLLIKRTDSTGSWFIIDSVRDIASLGAANTEGSADSQHKQLFADAGDAEGTYNSSAGDFTSNGYKLRSTNNSTNASGGTFIYFAFAEHPFVTSEGTPVTAI